MIRRVLAWSVALLLIASAEARERTPAEQARIIARGSKIVVALKTRQTLEGRLGQVRQDGFTLEPLVPGAWSSRDLLFQDVRKIGSAKQLRLNNPLLLPLGAVISIPYLIYCSAKRNCSL